MKSPTDRVLRNPEGFGSLATTWSDEVEAEEDEILRDDEEEVEELRSPGLSDQLENSKLEDDPPVDAADAAKEVSFASSSNWQSVKRNRPSKQQRQRNLLLKGDKDLMPPPSTSKRSGSRKRPNSGSPQEKPPTKKIPKPGCTYVTITFRVDNLAEIPQNLADSVREYLDVKIGEAEGLTFAIQIDTRTILGGHLIYICANPETANWIVAKIEEFYPSIVCSENMQPPLRGWLVADFKQAVISIQIFSKTIPNYLKFFQQIAIQNPGFDVNWQWRAIRSIPCPQDNPNYFLCYFRVVEDILLYIRANSSTLFYLSSSIAVREHISGMI